MKTDLLRTALPQSTDWYCDLGHVRSSFWQQPNITNHEEHELQWFSKPLDYQTKLLDYQTIISQDL